MSDTTNGVNDEPAPATDTYHRVLANHRRRIVIDVLEVRSKITFDDLAADLATREGDEVDRRDVEISLHHHHLPVLVDAGLIEYDSDRGRVTTRRAFDELFSPAHFPAY